MSKTHADVTFSNAQVRDGCGRRVRAYDVTYRGRYLGQVRLSTHVPGRWVYRPEGAGVTSGPACSLRAASPLTN